MGVLMDLHRDQAKLNKIGIASLAVVSAGFWMTTRIFSQPQNALQGLSSAAVVGKQIGPKSLVVQVSGEVKTPGLYTVTENSRVEDAIKKAKGITRNADMGRVNLADPLLDGDKLTIPSLSDPESVAVLVHATKPASLVSSGSGSSRSTKSGSSKKQLPAPGSIAINSATVQDFQNLPGVGPKTALLIVEYRQSRGSFASIDELSQVKGIGPKKLAALRPYVRL